MNDRYGIKRGDVDRIFYWTVFVVAFSLPLHQRISTILLFIPVVITLIQLMVYKKSFSWNTYILLPAAYYALHIIALSYTHNLSSGLYQLEIKAALIAIPFFVMVNTDVLAGKTRQLLMAFAAGTLLGALICTANAFINSVEWVDGSLHFNAAVIVKSKGFFESNYYGGNYFFHSHLSIFHHPSYFGLYVSFTIIFLFLLIRDFKESRAMKWLCICGIIFLLIFSYFLSSKATFLALLGSLFIMLAMLLRKLKIVYRIVMVAAIAGLIFLFFKFNYRMRDLLFDTHKTEQVDLDSPIGIRKVLWKAAVVTGMEHPLLGIGPGDAQEELYKNIPDQYKSDQLDLAPLNAHNQFLQSFMSLGIIGLATIVAMLILPFLKLREELLMLFIMFVVIGVIHLFTESMLERSSGVKFFTFLYCIILASKRNEQL
jgi:O-antigen ligase